MLSTQLFAKILLIHSIFILSSAYDCIWDQSTNSVQTQLPLLPYRSCLAYCSKYFSKTPQKAYFNLTSHMCQPRRKCLSSQDYYDYATNNCYEDQKLEVQVESELPESFSDTVHIAHPSAQMNCLNGYIETDVPINGLIFCLCEAFWENSETVDLNGIPFKCDKVIDEPQKYFYNRLVFDKNGKIVRYGPFSLQQVTTILNSLRSLQIQQKNSYIYGNYESIIFALEETLPKQAVIRQFQILYLIGILVVLFLLIGISFYEQDQLSVRVRRSEFKNKIVEVMKNQDHQTMVRQRY